MIEFKIADEADQQFSAILNGRRVTLRLRYNTISRRWNLDVAIDDLPVLHGRRIVNGVDVLETFDFGIGMIFALPAAGDAEPDRTNLPTGVVRLYHTTETEVEAVLT